VAEPAGNFGAGKRFFRLPGRNLRLDLSHGTACLIQNARFLAYTTKVLSEIKGTGQY
jgi:hypothetical protein